MDCKRIFALLAVAVMLAVMPMAALASYTEEVTAPDGHRYSITVIADDLITFEDFETPLGAGEETSPVTVVLISLLAAMGAGYTAVLLWQQRSIRRLEKLLQI